jgi:hypothetical protein
MWLRPGASALRDRGESVLGRQKGEELESRHLVPYEWGCWRTSRDVGGIQGACARVLAHGQRGEMSNAQ